MCKPSWLLLTILVSILSIVCTCLCVGGLGGRVATCVGMTCFWSRWLSFVLVKAHWNLTILYVLATSDDLLTLGACSLKCTRCTRDRNVQKCFDDLFLSWCTCMCVCHCWARRGLPVWDQVKTVLSEPSEGCLFWLELCTPTWLVNLFWHCSFTDVN